jgi:hypothetical protein
MTAPTTTWKKTTWKKLTGGLRRDGNPLRRRSDLIEAWLLPAAVAAFLVLSPLLAGAVVLLARAQISQARYAELSWQHRPAVVLQPAAGPEARDNGSNTWVVWTKARWTEDGRRMVGSVPVPAKTRAGSTVTIWLDPAGNIRLPPPTAHQVGSRVIEATLMTLAGLAVVLTSAVLLTRRVLHWRRLAGWEAAWLSFAPASTRPG